MDNEVKEQLISTSKKLEDVIEEAKRLTKKLYDAVDNAYNPSCQIPIHSSMLNLSVRSLNVLDSIGCETVADVIDYGIDKLRNVPKCGAKTVKNIKDAFANIGVYG